MTLQTYCMFCVAAWAGFAIYFFRKEIFLKKPGAAAESGHDDAASSQPDDNFDIIGRPQTALPKDEILLPPAPVRTPAAPAETETKTEPAGIENDTEEELDIEYEYDKADLDALKAQADAVPDIALDTAMADDAADWDELDRQIAELHEQTEDETRELLTDRSAKSFGQLSFAFDTAASPCRSLKDDHIAGTTLRDISRTDMFEQAYRANMRRVDEILKSVSCRVINSADDGLDVVPTEEDTAANGREAETTDASWQDDTQPDNRPQANTAQDDTRQDNEPEPATSFIEDFLNTNN